MSSQDIQQVESEARMQIKNAIASIAIELASLKHDRHVDPTFIAQNIEQYQEIVFKHLVWLNTHEFVASVSGGVRSVQQREGTSIAGQEALIPIPMGVGPEMILSDILSSYLLQQKKRITDMSVGPMAVNLLVALEQYRQSRDLDALASELGVPASIVAVYRSTHDRRRRDKAE